MARIHTALSALKARNEKAMGLFLTSGFPDPDSTLPLLHAIDEAGADFIELGMPFSDPLAEGLPIQRSSTRALSHGVTMDDAFRTASSFRENSETPLLLMGYINPVLRYGVDRFCQQAGEAGVDGLILPDLPVEENAMIEKEAEKQGLSLVYLIAPNTPDERIAQIDQLASAFVYAVSVTGLTGSSLDAMDAVTSYLQRARRLVQNNPLMVGFGISSHEDAVRLSQSTDGFIVGSALIRQVEALWDDDALDRETRLERVRRFVHNLKHGESETASPIKHR